MILLIIQIIFLIVQFYPKKEFLCHDHFEEINDTDILNVE